MTRCWMCVVVLLGWVYRAGSAEAPLQGAALLKVDAMVVLAHPDDEISVAATMARLTLLEGRRVAATYVTRGEGGANMVGTQAGRSLGILREAELREAWRKLGVYEVQFLDQSDFGYTENLAVSLEKWGHVETLRRLVRQIRAYRPDVLVSWNPAPHPGQHGHHQAAGWLAAEAFEASGKTNWFAEQLSDEGLTAWQPRKLFFSGDIGRGNAPKVVTDVTGVLKDGRDLRSWVGVAMSEHRSQAFGNMGASPWLRRMTNQTFTLAKSVLSPGVEVPADFFGGLPVSDAHARRTPIPAPARPRFELRFVGRPAVENYRDWMLDQAMDSLLSEFVPDVPVIAGRPNEVHLEIINRTELGENTMMEFEVPPGWKVDPARSNIRFSGQRTNHIIVDVVPPDGFPADAVLKAACRVGGVALHGEARMHPVPRARVPRWTSQWEERAAPLASDSWSKLPVHEIPGTRTWQGNVRDDADLSARVRLAHDGNYLYVEVQVRDDVVINNLTPDDIRGHWRTDSVEICLDPSAGADHTFGSFKLGIVPFDRMNQVGAARDADRTPGPLARSAPDSRVASWKTAEGYVVRARISLAEAGVKLEKSRRVGFNVLVYDGDKADAADGENVNRARLAWAPRHGVQGRPEDWGRVTLD